VGVLQPMARRRTTWRTLTIEISNFVIHTDTNDTIAWVKFHVPLHAEDPLFLSRKLNTLNAILGGLSFFINFYSFPE
jgi:hypothetical protein